jgi:hypothetical protein
MNITTARKGWMVFTLFSMLLIVGCATEGQRIYPGQMKATMQALKEEPNGGIHPIVLCEPGDLRSIEHTTIEACNIQGSGWKIVMNCPGGAEWKGDHYLCKL